MKLCFVLQDEQRDICILQDVHTVCANAECCCSVMFCKRDMEISHVQAWLSWSEQGIVEPQVVGSVPSNPENSDSHGFELHRPSIKRTKQLLKVIKAIIIIYLTSRTCRYLVCADMSVLLQCVVLQEEHGDSLSCKKYMEISCMCQCTEG